MSSKMLYEAIALVRAGRNDDARLVIFEIIRNEPQNEMAWMWLAETLSSNVDRMKVLLACMKENPNSKIAQMAIDKMKNKMGTAILQMDTENPFTEGSTFDPLAPQRTGHTGAIIGFDGSFILSEVPDFKEVIDLRSPGSSSGAFFAGSVPSESSEEPIIVLPSSSVESEYTENIIPEAIVEPDPEIGEESFEREEPIEREELIEREEPVELEFEPDLSDLFRDERSEEAVEENADEDEEEEFDLSRIISTPALTEDDELIDLEELSPEELGFVDDASELTSAENSNLNALFEDEELVEDRVLESSAKKYNAKRKKQERRMLYFIGGMFLLIGVLCITAIGLIYSRSRGTALIGVPTLTLIPTEIVLPSATEPLPPTQTATLSPTATPTATATATPLVYLSEDAIVPESANTLVLRLRQNLTGEFYPSLDGNLVAVVDGNTIQLWSAATGNLRYNLLGHTAAVTDVVFSPDGNLLVSGSSDFTVRVWNTQTGALTKTFALDADAINRIYGDRTRQYPRRVSVDISPDGGTVAAGGFGFVNVLDVPSGLVRGSFILNDETLTRVTTDVVVLQGFEVKFNENGWVLSAAMSKMLVGLDSLDATPLYQYDLGPLARVTYDANRIHMVEADAGGIILRKLETGEILNGFGGRKVKPNQAAPDYAVSENWTVLGIEADGENVSVQLSVWDIADDNNLINFDGICTGTDCRPPAFAIAPEGNWIAVETESDGVTALKVVDLISLAEVHSFSGLAAPINGINFSPDGKLVAALDGGSIVHVWDIEIGIERAAIQTEALTDVSFSRDGAFLFAWNTKSIQVWSQPMEPPSGAFPGLDSAALDEYLKDQSANVQCQPGGVLTHQNLMAQQCNLDAATFTLSTVYTYDADRYVFLVEFNLVMKFEAQLDQAAITAINYVAGIPYEDAKVAEVQSWITENIATLTPDTRKETSFGSLSFVISLTEDGYKLMIQIPAS